MNILVTGPSIGEKFNKEDNQQTYKCMELLKNKGINISEIWYFSTEEINNIDELQTSANDLFENVIIKKIDNFPKVNENIFKNKNTSFSFAENFDLLYEKFTDQNYGEQTEFYLNLMSGPQDYRKFLYELGFVLENTHIIVPELEKKNNGYRISENLIKTNYEEKILEKPNEKNILIEYFNEVLDKPENMEKYLNEINIQEYLKKNNFKNLEDVIYRKSTKFKQSRKYIYLNNKIEFEKAIDELNYAYANSIFEEIDFKEGSLHEEISSKLYSLALASSSAYDIHVDSDGLDIEESEKIYNEAVRQYFNGLLCINILIRKNMPILALNEFENLLNPTFYKNLIINNCDENEIKGLYNSTGDKNFEDNILKRNNKLTKLPSNFNENRIDNIITMFRPLTDVYDKNFTNNLRIIKNNNHPNRANEKINLLFEKLYTVYTKKGINYFDNKFKCFDSSAKDLQKIYLINKVYRYFDYIFSFNFENKKLTDYYYRGRNFYLNILGCFREYDSDDANLYEAILKNKNDFNPDDFSPNGTTLDQYVIDILNMASIKQLNKALDEKIRPLIYEKEVFKSIRNKSTHNYRCRNIYSLDLEEEYKNYIKGLGIKDNNDSLLEYVKYFYNIFFGEYDLFIDNCDSRLNILDNENEVLKDLIKEIKFKDNENIYDYNLLKNIKHENNNDCFVAYLTDKNPHFCGAYSSTFNILLNIIKNKTYNITKFVFLITKEFKNCDVYENIKNNTAKEVKKILENDEINIEFKLISNLVENDNDIEYSYETGFKILKKLYDDDLYGYRNVFFDGTAGMPQLILPISLLSQIYNNIIIYECPYDYKTLSQFILNELPKKNTNSYKTQRASKGNSKAIAKLVEKNQDDEMIYNFTNSINIAKDNLHYNKFYALPSLLKNYFMEDAEVLEAINNLSNWQQEKHIENFDFYALLLTNLKYFKEGKEYFIFTANSGLLLEKLVDLIYTHLGTDSKIYDKAINGISTMVMDKNDYQNICGYVDKFYIDNSLVSENVRKNINENWENDTKNNYIRIFDSNYIFGYLNYRLLGEKDCKIFTNDLICLYKLYKNRNDIIHKNNKNSDFNELESDITKGFDVMERIWKLVPQNVENYNYILEKYNENKEKITKKLG